MLFWEFSAVAVALVLCSSDLLVQTEKSGQCLLYAWQKCACFLSSTVPGNLISHIFRENEVCQDTEWERYFSYESIDVPEIYSGPRLTFPLSVSQVADLVEAFKNKQVCLFLYDFYPIILQLWMFWNGDTHNL